VSSGVAVLGGGPAGLATGWALAELGADFRILEAAPEPGGNARTLRHGDFLFDTGPHRFHDRDPEATRRILELMGDDLQEVEAPSRVLWEGRVLDFPLRPLQALSAGGLGWSLRAGLELLYARAGSRPASAADFAAWARSRFGRSVANAFLIPFSEKLWGLPAEELSPDIAGRRLPGFGIFELLRELVRSGRRSKHLEGRFLYPRGGYGRIVEAMAAKIAPERLWCRAPVRRVAHSGARITCVDYEQDGERRALPATAFVNSLPITMLLGLLDPPPPREVAAAAAKLRFRDCILVALFLDQPSVSDAACLYFSERDLEFTRAHEPRNRSRAMSPAGKTSLVVEFPCFRDEVIWSRPDEALATALVERLERFGLIDASRVLDRRVVRLRDAYPVYTLDYRVHSQVVLGYLQGFENLSTIGRGGSYFYGHVHDFVSAGFAAADRAVELLDAERTTA
jgi:protoporphyrinogen oxidase